MQPETQKRHNDRVIVTRLNGGEYTRGGWDIELTNPNDEAHHAELDHGQYTVALKCSCGYREILWTKGY